MANRHLSRSLVVQTLFEWDFNSIPPTETGSEIGPAAALKILERDRQEFAPGFEEDKFAIQLLEGIFAHREEIDAIIKQAAPEWPLDKIAIVDRNVLRLGLYELLFADRGEVPARVAINEAIELAKTFGSETSGKFINGVLGTVYRELGEPDREEVPAKKRRVKDANYEDLPVEKLGGAVVYGRGPGAGQPVFALVHDIFDYWTLSKGHIEEGEAVEAGTAREVKEELSLDIEIKEEIGSNEYVANDPKKGRIRKNVSYFLAKANDINQLKLNKNQGLDDARWFSGEEILELKMYDDVLPIITRAIEKLSKSDL